MKTEALKKIIWAYDALSESDTQKNVQFLLGALARATGVKIEPVYILNPPYADGSETTPSNLEQAYTALGNTKLAALKEHSQIQTLTSGKVLINREPSIRAQVRTLVDYAKQQNADAIVVSTHGRKGAARFFLGSFAETLSIHSDVPVFTVNPQTMVRESIAKILFPTNFAARFRPDFEQAVALAKSLDATVTLWYKQPILSFYMMNPEVYRFIEEETSERREIAKEWQSWAMQSGVKVELRIDDRPEYLTSALEDFATSGDFDLVAMSTQADTASAILVGSVARQMIRHSPCPVWIIKSKSE